MLIYLAMSVALAQLVLSWHTRNSRQLTVALVIIATCFTPQALAHLFGAPVPSAIAMAYQVLLIIGMPAAIWMMEGRFREYLGRPSVTLAQANKLGREMSYGLMVPGICGYVLTNHGYYLAWICVGILALGVLRTYMPRLRGDRGNTPDPVQLEL